MWEHIPAQWKFTLFQGKKIPGIKCSIHGSPFHSREMKNVGGLSAGALTDFFLILKATL